MNVRGWWTVGLLCVLCLGYGNPAFAQAAGKTFTLFISSTVDGDATGAVTFSADGSYLYSGDGDAQGQFAETVDATTGVSTLQGTIEGGDGYFGVFMAQTTPSTYAGDTPVTILTGFGFGSAGDFFVFAGWSFDVTTSVSSTEDPSASETNDTAPTARERLQNRRQ